MGDEREFDVHPKPPPGAAPRGGGKALPWVIAVVLALVAIVPLGWLLFSSNSAETRRAQLVAERERQRAMDERFRAEAETQELGAVTVRSGEASAAPREVAVDDPEGALLWASPTNGGPISLAFVPAGSQCLVHLRPAQLAAHPEGEKILAALGPWGHDAVEQLQTLAGAKLAEIDALLVSVVVRAGGILDACLRIDLLEPWDDVELARRLPDAEQRRAGETTYYEVGGRAWFLASAAQRTATRALVVCPADLAEELIGSAGAPPLLVRDIEELVKSSDVQRAATAIVSPKFLAAGGTHLVEGEAEPVREMLDALLGNEATAVAVSAHWDDSFFLELRTAPALNVSPRWLATTMNSRMAAAADEVETIVAERTWPAYGRKVLERFPAMIDKLAASTRRGEIDRQAVVRAYLPAIAGHNLLMGAELMLTQAGGDSTVPAPEDAAPLTIEQRLAANASLAFPKESLQRALELLAEDLGVEIAIDGAALQTEGITQNQTLAIDLRERPAGELLVKILRQANPDRTAESAADPRQKLVYYVEPGAAGGGRIIVTTRAAAETAGKPLAGVFVGAGE